MKNTIRLNILVLEDTKKKLEEIAQKTHRGLGATIDWLVEEKHDELYRLPAPLYKITPSEK